MLVKKTKGFLLPPLVVVGAVVDTVGPAVVVVVMTVVVAGAVVDTVGPAVVVTTEVLGQGSTATLMTPRIPKTQ